MPWASDTKAKICIALELPVTVPSYLQEVDRAMTDALAYGSETVVTQIEGYLTQYFAAQTSLNSEAGNAGLIRADVLEWQPNTRSAGYKQEMGRLRMSIAKILLLEHLLSSASNRVAIKRG